MSALSMVVVLLAAAPKLASPGLAGVNVTAEMQAFVTDHLNQQLVIAGVDVLSSSQVAAVVGLERQKQLLGCTATNECVAEFANALGVDGLLLGNVGKFGQTIQLDVRVAAASDAANLALFSLRIPDENGLLDGITQAARAIADQLSKKLKVSLVPLEQPAATVSAAQLKTQYGSVRKGGVVTFVAGAVVLVGGVIVAAAAPTPTGGGTSDLQAVGGGLIILSLPTLLIGGLLWIFGGNEQVPVKAAFLPTRDGFSFALGGSF